MVNPANDEDADNVIAAAIIQNDLHTAFRLLLAHYGPRVHSLCCRMLKNRVHAEDVMQEALIKAFEGVSALRDPTRLRPWVMRIATTTCLDTLRATKRRGEVESAFADADTATLAADLLAELASSEEKRALEDCLAQLPIAKRAAVLGRFFASLGYEDLATAMNESPDTIRIRIRRSLPELRACLESKGLTS